MASPKEPWHKTLRRVLLFAATYTVGWLVLEGVTTAIPEVRTILIVLGLVFGLPFLAVVWWREFAAQPTRRP